MLYCVFCKKCTQSGLNVYHARHVFEDFNVHAACKNCFEEHGGECSLCKSAGNVIPEGLNYITWDEVKRELGDAFENDMRSTKANNYRLKHDATTGKLVLDKFIAPVNDPMDDDPKFTAKDYMILKSSSDINEIIASFDALRCHQNAKMYLTEKIDMERLRVIHDWIKDTTYLSEFLEAIEDLCGLEFAIDVMEKPEKLRLFEEKQYAEEKAKMAEEKADMYAKMEAANAKITMTQMATGAFTQAATEQMLRVRSFLNQSHKQFCNENQAVITEVNEAIQDTFGRPAYLPGLK